MIPKKTLRASRTTLACFACNLFFLAKSTKKSYSQKNFTGFANNLSVLCVKHIFSRKEHKEMIPKILCELREQAERALHATYFFSQRAQKNHTPKKTFAGFANNLSVLCGQLIFSRKERKEMIPKKTLRASRTILACFA